MQDWLVIILQDKKKLSKKMLKFDHEKSLIKKKNTENISKFKNISQK